MESEHEQVVLVKLESGCINQQVDCKRSCSILPSSALHLIKEVAAHKLEYASVLQPRLVD